MYIYAISVSASGETKAIGHHQKTRKKKISKKRERKKYEINEIEIVKSCFFLAILVVVITQKRNCNEI